MEDPPRTRGAAESRKKIAQHGAGTPSTITQVFRRIESTVPLLPPSISSCSSKVKQAKEAESVALPSKQVWNEQGEWFTAWGHGKDNYI